MIKEKLRLAEIRWLKQLGIQENQLNQEKVSFSQDLSERLNVDISQIVGFTEEKDQMVVIIKEKEEDQINNPDGKDVQ